MNEIRIAYIGGGSRYWAHHFIADLALCPELSGELVLHDIDQMYAAMQSHCAQYLRYWSIELQR